MEHCPGPQDLDANALVHLLKAVGFQFLQDGGISGFVEDMWLDPCDHVKYSRSHRLELYNKFKEQSKSFFDCIVVIFSHINRPRKRRFCFSGGGNFQAKLKRTTQQTVLVSMFVTSVTSALIFVTANLLFFSASCFLARRKNKQHRFRVQV